MANVKNYIEQGGARSVVGGSLDVVSGGEIDIESGASLKLDGTAISKTAAQINALPIVEQTAEAAITQADAADQGGTYAEADVDSIADLANVNKAKINAILAKLVLANIIAE